MAAKSTKTKRVATISAKTESNPHVEAAQKRARSAAKSVRRGTGVATSHAKTAVLAAAGGVALGATVAWAFGSTFVRALRG